VECQFSVKKVKIKPSRSQDIATTQNWRHVYLQAANQMQADPTPTKLGLCTVRPNLLNMRHLATGLTAACHVGSRLWHAFLFV